MLLQQRKSWTMDKIESDSLQLLDHLSTLLQTLGACTVASYHPASGEPDIRGLYSNPLFWATRWALPVCVSESHAKQLKFRQYKPGDALILGAYQIPVPAEGEFLVPDCLLIPCVGFNRQGARMGHGAGWYDYTLAALQTPPCTVGVAFSTTELAFEFQEPHDILLDYIVTEHEIIAPGRDFSE